MVVEAPFAVPSVLPALPEILIAVGAMLMLMLGAFRGNGARRQIDMVGIGFLAAALIVVLTRSDATVVTFGGSFVIDGFTRVMKALTLIASILAIVMSWSYLKANKLEMFEYSVLILLATLGMMMMISANDLIALYLGLELQSLALYVIASIHRDDAKSSEAGLKYFVLGALSSGMLLYGASLIYGYTGNVNFTSIAAVLEGRAGTGATFGLVFVTAGLAFKISAVPFHMWTPDVYEGSPTPVTAFFAGAPKMAAMALLVRVMVDAFPAITREWQQIIAFIAIASMVLGAFAAIGQQNLKRLMAYSSIGNMGYALVGLAAGNQEGVQGVVVFLATYLVTTLGVFACIMGLRGERQHVETIGDLAGLSRTNPTIAAVLALLMFSLIGIPPLAGFFGKFYVFAAAIKAELFLLAVIGVVASVVSAFYYLRIIKVMYMDEPVGVYAPVAPELQAVAVASGALTGLFMVVAGPIVAMAAVAARALL
jgi:NADH-quinone oxidoreductase subunit N